MRKLFILPILIAFSNCIHSQNYYFSSTNGNDLTGDGSIGSPWASIDKLNTLSLLAGNNIFFKRGDLFKGEISLNSLETGTFGLPITFSTYGAGANPIIKGTDTLETTWTVYPSVLGAYQINTANKIHHLIINGMQMESAKYPDTYLLTVDDMLPGNTGFTDAALPGIGFDPTNYPICVRTSLWTWETRKVAAYSSSNLTFDYLPQLDSFPQYGYYFYNHLNLLNNAGEWYSDTVSQILYYYPSNNLAPSTQLIEGSVFNYGITGTSANKYITIKGIDFFGQYLSGVEFGTVNNGNIIIDSCSFSNQYLYGIHLGATNNEVTHCNFENIEGRGIYFQDGSNSFIQYCTFINIGPYRSGGTNDQDNFTAITCYDPVNIQIDHNIIDSIGYCGIRCDGSNSIVEKNVLTNTMLLLTDGGALKSFGAFSDNVIYRNNFVSNCNGNLTGAPPATTFKSVALYLDFYTNNCSFLYNTVENIAGNGIFINGGSDNHIIKGNIIYGAQEHIYTNDRFTTDPIDGDSIINNVFYCTSPPQICVREGSRNDFIMGTYNNNYYINSYVQSHLVRRIALAVDDSFDLQSWQDATGYDMNTSDTYFDLTYPASNDTLIKNISDNSLLVNLAPNMYFDLDSNVVCLQFDLDPYTSRILINSGVQCPVGINNIDPHSMIAAVYPNPATNFTQIFIDALDGEYIFQLYSLSGQTILSNNLTNTITAIPVDQISHGMYYYRIVSSNHKVVTGKLIVQ